MATIVGGYIAGLSQLMPLTQLSAWVDYILGRIKLHAAERRVGNVSGTPLGPVIVGCLVAFISAAIAVNGSSLTSAVTDRNLRLVPTVTSLCYSISNILNWLIRGLYKIDRPDG